MALEEGNEVLRTKASILQCGLLYIIMYQYEIVLRAYQRMEGIVTHSVE